METQSLLERLREQGWVLERQGTEMVLYKGLLYAAHEVGIHSIETYTEQAPSDANGQTTIVRAIVELSNGSRFSGIGDANPSNVGRNIAPHAIRMAETRAKGRALRDALNIGAVMAEELGDAEPISSGIRGPRAKKVEGPSDQELAAFAKLQQRAEAIGFYVADWDGSGSLVEYTLSETTRVKAAIEARKAEQATVS